MRFRARPVIVEAFKIKQIVASVAGGSLRLVLENGDTVAATPAMTSRLTPLPGDYWVVQSDGYSYLNPKDVFERKYQPIEEGQ
jgi:hypothetical protein